MDNRSNRGSMEEPMEMLRKSIPLKNKKDEDTLMTKICGCGQLESFKKYFTVSNKDVMKRVLSNLMFWKGEFFQEGDEYDL